MFVQGVCPISNSTKTIKRRDTKSCCEVAIRASASTSLRQLASELGRDSPRCVVKAHHRIGSFEWRSINAALNFERRARNFWHQGGQCRAQPFRVGHRRDPHIY
jgi:hypothetical protein